MEGPGGAMREVPLNSREMPETLKRALAEDQARRAATAAGETDTGLFSSLKRILGR